MSRKAHWHASSMEAAPSGRLPRNVLELEHAAFKEEALERFRMQQGLAQACFRSLVLVNGGAIIALFTLIGSTADVARQVSGLSLWFAVAAFAAGLASTIVANVAGFFMQIHYANMTERQMWNKELELAGREPTYEVNPCLKAGDWWEKMAISNVAGGVAFFVAGSTLCFLAFLG